MAEAPPAVTLEQAASEHTWKETVPLSPESENVADKAARAFVCVPAVGERSGGTLGNASAAGCVTCATPS